MTSQALQEAIKANEDCLAENQEQCLLLVPLLRLLAEGKPVPLERLAAVSRRPLEAIQSLLQCSDIEVDSEGRIVGWGLSLVPTPHQFRLGEQTLYAWCALDTLLLPALLGRTAHIVSICPATGKSVSLTVTPTQIERLEPASAVVSVRLPEAETDLCEVRGSICLQGHFFESHEDASAWPSLHPQALLLTVEEAAQLGRELARQFLALAPGSLLSLKNGGISA